MSNRRDNVSDIIVIGAQRAATCWLHSMLNIHPRVYAFPDNAPETVVNKEAHYWNKNFHRGEDWYRSLMRSDDPAKLSLDVTPEYALLNDAQIADCKRLNPTAHVIYILRDPVARAVSSLKMHMSWQPERSKDESLHLVDDLMDLMRWARISIHGAYVDNYRRWARQYHTIQVLNFDDLHRDPHSFIHRIYGICGLEMSEIAGERRDRFNAAVTVPTWVAPDFDVSDPVVEFLQGYFWRQRENIGQYFDMTFDESPPQV